MPAPLRILSPLHRASRQIALDFERRMADLDAQGQECHLLSFLRSYAPCPVGELVRVFGLKASTLTSMLDRLERRGLVTREVDPEDRRSFLVRITGEGEAVADRVNRIVRDFERKVLARVSARDLRGFEAVLAAVADVTQVDVRRKEKR